MSDPATWEGTFGDDFGASASGERVNLKSSLRVSGIWRGVNLIANACAGTKLFALQQGEGENDQKRDKQHHAYWLLNRSTVHPSLGSEAASGVEIPSQQLKKTLTFHAILRGNGYAYIVRDRAGRPVQLKILDPTRMTLVKVKGRLWYVYTTNGSIEDDNIGNGNIHWLSADDVLHIRGLANDGIQGYSLLDLARDDLGNVLAQKQFVGKFFKNAATPRVVIQVPKTLSEGAYNRLTRSWSAMQEGVRNAHKTAILEEDAKVEKLSFSAEEAQLIEAQKLSREECANWLMLPVHKLGGEGRTSYASLAEENQSVLDDAYDPWFVTWETEGFLKLLTEEQKRTESHDLEFHRNSLIRNDLVKRMASYRSSVGRPIFTPNEARHMEGKPSIDGGDTLYVPANMNPVGPDGTPVDEDADDDTDNGTAADRSGAGSEGTPDARQDDREGTETTGETPMLIANPAVRTMIRQTIVRMSRRLVKSAERGKEPWDDLAERSVLTDAIEPCADLITTDSRDIVSHVVNGTRGLFALPSCSNDDIGERVATSVMETFYAVDIP